jgi:hypothetical protein
MSGIGLKDLYSISVGNWKHKDMKHFSNLTIPGVGGGQKWIHL